MQRFLNSISRKIGRIIRSGCFGSFSTTAMRENGQELLRDWVPSGNIDGFKSLRNAGAALKIRPGGEGIKLINEFTYLCAERYYKLIHDASVLLIREL